MFGSVDYQRLEKLARRGDFSEAAVGIRLAAALRVAHLTQAEMGRLVGRTASAIGNAVRGDNYPDIQVFFKLWTNYHIEPKFMMMGDLGNVPVDMQMRLLVALEDVYNDRGKRSGSD